MESTSMDERHFSDSELHLVTEAALTYLDLDDLLNELLERITEILDVDTAAILLVEDDGETLAARAAKGLEEEVERGFRLHIGAGFAGRVARTREPVVINDLDSSPIEVVNPVFRERGVRSLLGVPLVVERRLVGVLHIGTLHQRSFAEEDVGLLRLVGDRAALAIEHARLVDERQVSQALQRTFLPKRFPEIPGLDIAARYLPAAAGPGVGGDWYDVLDLGDGSVGLAIGDVAGKGIAAAAAMGEIRSSLRAYATEGLPPDVVVSKLDRYLESEPVGKMATLVYAKLDLAQGSLSLVRAGHPLPLLIHLGGRVSFIGANGGPPVGIGLDGRRTLERVTIEPGCAIVLYTDGLIERRGNVHWSGEEALAGAAAGASVTPRLLCRQLTRELTAGAPMLDDLALLVAQQVSP
jgi:sigma-B regulation protein RsbU (phosphoserine phosphatase)